MLPLNELYEDFDLAYFVLQRYDFDKDKTKDVINYFRISSNAIYPFVKDGKLCFLRLCPLQYKALRDVLAEVEFVDYLVDKGYHAPKVIPNNVGEKVYLLTYNGKTYVVTAFAKLSGTPLDDYFDDNSATSEMIFKYGQALGQLHALSKNFTPHVKRRTQQDFVAEIRSRLDNFADEQIRKAFALDSAAFLAINKTDENYGLIHYDFELDNVFYNPKADVIGAIDYDDSFYSFFALDYVRAINELTNIPNANKQDFHDGYTSVMPPDDTIDLHLLDRIAKYQHYSELLYVLSDIPTDAPDWMQEIISTLQNRLTKLHSALIATH